MEVTKLSLLLKVLEGETAETIGSTLRLFHERALPDLSNNIKCGNSLIGPDFYEGRQMDMFDEEERRRINVFDWHAEFPEVFPPTSRTREQAVSPDSGFDAVIGNPPWGASFGDAELAYLRSSYNRIVDRMVDSYIYLTDKAIRLATNKGHVGFIIPSTLLNQVETKSARQLLLSYKLSNLISLGQGIFGNRVLNTSTIFVAGDSGADSLILLDLSSFAVHEKPLAIDNGATTNWTTWKQMVERDPHYTFSVANAGSSELLDHLRAELPALLEMIDGEIQRGVSPDVAASHVLDSRAAKEARIEKELLKPSISGTQIKRYKPWIQDQYILYTTRDTDIETFPKALAFLKSRKHLNTCREAREGKHPYWALHRPRDPQIFRSPKFIGLTTTKRIELILDTDQSLFVTDAMYVFSIKSDYDPLALMAIMHSKLFLFLYRTANQGESRVIPQVKASKLQTLPAPTMKCGDARTQPLAAKSESMLTLHKSLAAAKTDHDKTTLQRQIDATDNQIDQLVYQLYGLTDDEIKIVEGET